MKTYTIQKLSIVRTAAITFIAFALAAAGSCSLDIETYDQLTPENALVNESDLNAAVTGIYFELRGGGWSQYNCAEGSLLILQEACTDEGNCNWNWDQQINFMWTPESGSWMTGFYFSMMPAITKATALIERMKPLSISAPVKRSCNAQIRTLRAIFAYDLYDLYGPLPIVIDPEIALNPSVADKWQPQRPTAAEYVRFLESELQDVQENLPDQTELSSGEWGRMTVGIAQMYLLKLFMHEAGQERYYRSGDETLVTKWWTKTDSLTNVMINSRQYQLMDNYMSIWAPANQKNKEVIFAIPCFPQGGLGNIFLAEALPSDYKSQEGISLTAWGGFTTYWDVFDSFAAGDKRRDGLKHQYWNGTRMIDIRTERTYGPFPMKYQENSSTTGQWDASDYVINRYAEVLLARAEALNELNGPTEDVKKLIHQVRSRAFDNYVGSVNEQLVDDISDKGAMRDHILAERRWEFCWEGMRRPDLIRHGKLIQDAQARGKYNAENKHILYCIPQSVRYENPNINQNDGWN